MTELSIRAAEPADADALVTLVAEFYGEAHYRFDAPVTRRAVARLLADGEVGRAWLATVDGRTAGYAVVTFGFSLEYGGRDAFVDELFVRPAHRRRGLGERLLATIESAAAEHGVGALHLEVEGDNDGAASLYRRRGFAGNARRLLTKRI